MERNWDLIRDLLIEVEAGTEPNTRLRPEEGNWQKAEHMALLIEAGYCTGPLKRTESGYPMVALSRITWEGYDLLDSIRNDTIWSRVKNSLGAVGGKVSVEVLKSLVTATAKDMLNIT